MTHPLRALLALSLAGCFTEFPGGQPADLGGQVESDLGTGPAPDVRADPPPADASRDIPLRPDRGLVEPPDAAPDGAETPDAAAPDVLDPDAEPPPADAAELDVVAPPDVAEPDGCAVAVEVCNGLDDDCDGEVDEASGMGPCEAGVGACRAAGQWVCTDDGWLCDAVAEPGQSEVCNGLDDDCDGAVDNLGDCRAGVGACEVGGALVCDEAGEPRCEALSPEAPLRQPERCNTVDDDCDGRVDEGACVDYLVQNCAVHLGYSDVNDADPEPARDWRGCAEGPPQLEGSARCTSTMGDGLFHRMPLTGDVNRDDILGVAFKCAGPTVAVDEWLERACRLQLIHSDNRDLDELFNVDAGMECADRVVEGGNPNPRCVSTRGDGLYHPMWLRGDVNYDDNFGVAWRCADAERQAATQALTERVAFTLAWQFRRDLAIGCGGPDAIDRAEQWEDCPPRGENNDGEHRCASSSGDGAFHGFSIGGTIERRDVRECSSFGIALRALPQDEEDE